MKRIIFVLSFLFILMFTSCSDSKEEKIICSSYPVYDLASRIIKDKYEVTCFIPSSVEPHEYEPTAKKLTELYNSAIYFEIGLNFEPFKAPEEIKDKTVTLSDSVNIRYSRKNTSTADPHIWLSINNAVKMMETIKNSMCKLDSENSDFYLENYNNEKAKFEELEHRFSEALAGKEGSYIATTHEAFGYMCDDYGLNQLSLMGISTENKPTTSQMAEMYDILKEKNIKVIFSEEMVSDEFASSVAQSLNITCNVLNTIEGKEDDADDYLSLMEENLEALIYALN